MPPKAETGELAGKSSGCMRTGAVTDIRPSRTDRMRNLSDRAATLKAKDVVFLYRHSDPETTPGLSVACRISSEGSVGNRALSKAAPSLA
jgi:hypothetical protein